VRRAVQVGWAKSPQRTIEPYLNPQLEGRTAIRQRVAGRRDRWWNRRRCG
jgi:hypothetical protein